MIVLLLIRKLVLLFLAQGGGIGALNNVVDVHGVIGSDVSILVVQVFNTAGWGYSSNLVSAITTVSEIEN